jgi:hypothetical protein
MTVDAMRQMSGEEYNGWWVYFKRKAQRQELEYKRANHNRR